MYSALEPIGVGGENIFFNIKLKIKPFKIIIP